MSVTEWKSLADHPSYDDIVASWGYEIVASGLVGDYQGDYLYFLRDGQQWGYLVVGYGSCSGCDSLQACNSREDVERLRSSLHSDIHWEDDAERMWSWLVARDTAGQFYGSNESVEEFLVLCLKHTTPPAFGETTQSLLKNLETPPGVIADAIEEENPSLPYVLSGLRDPHSGMSVLHRIHRTLKGNP